MRNPKGSLTADEKKLVKGFLKQGRRNQDIQALVNLGRSATINSARITEVKQNSKIVPAKPRDLDFYEHKKKSYDPQTGLNFYDDERLIRARESIILAVDIFNSPAMKFKAEVFAVLVNISWTYLLHEYYSRKNVEITSSDGRSLLLSQMLKRTDCPLSRGMIDNLESIKEIRDAVEHTLFRKSDLKFLSIFQACCLNFDKAICDLFGSDKTLKHDLAFSLQFAKLDFDQLADLHEFDVPQHIQALEKAISEDLGSERLTDMEYRFRVVYTLENSTKSKAHIKFVHPGEEGAEEVRNVLIKHELSDERFPFKAKTAAEQISKKSGKKFSLHNHTQAWRKFNARPRSTVKEPQNTNKEWCAYHKAHGDYTFSIEWVDFVSNYINDPQNFETLKKFKL